MAKVELKQPIVEEISNLLKEAKSAVIADYRGLTVEQDTELRKQLREAGVHYKVYKNTMISFAILYVYLLRLIWKAPRLLPHPLRMRPRLPAFSMNSRKRQTSLKLKAGVVEGTYYDADGIKVIATIPGREELLGKLLGKHPVSHREPGPCSQSDRGSKGRVICTGPVWPGSLFFVFMMTEWETAREACIKEKFNGGKSNGKVNDCRIY